MSVKCIKVIRVQEYLSGTVMGVMKQGSSCHQHCKCCIRLSSLEIRAIEDGYDGCDGYLLFMPTSDRHAGIFLFIFERKEKYPVSL